MESIKEIGVGVYRFQCKSCKSEFEVYRLSDFLYGEKLLLTKDGIDYVYLNCFEDKLMEELSNIVEKHLNKKIGYSQDSIYFFNLLFDATCDEVNGKKIDSSRHKYSCSKCKSDDTKELPINLWGTKKVTFPIVKHEKWNSMTNNEKALIIQDIFKRECFH